MAETRVGGGQVIGRGDAMVGAPADRSAVKLPLDRHGLGLNPSNR